MPDGSDKTTTKGVRFPLTRTMSEAKTHKRMLEAADDGS